MKLSELHKIADEEEINKNELVLSNYELLINDEVASIIINLFLLVDCIIEAYEK